MPLEEMKEMYVGKRDYLYVIALGSNNSKFSNCTNIDFNIDKTLASQYLKSDSDKI